MNDPVIETKNLSMRPFAESDLEWLVSHRSDGDIAKYLGGSALQTPEFVKKRLRFYMDTFAEKGYSMCFTSLKEIGYSFEKEYWGKGFATEAAVAWLDFGFRSAGLERIVAVAEPENEGSIKVMKKLGMKFEKSSLSYGLQVVRYSVEREVFYATHPEL